MKLRILGCGTSAGVPRIGNDWGACDPGEPRNRRTRSSLLIEAGAKRLLVDCGPDMREQLLSTNVGRIDGVIVTHDHADHCHGIDDLRRLAQILGDRVPLYARPSVLKRLANRFGYLFTGTTFYGAVAEPVAVGSELVFGEARLRFVDQPHGTSRRSEYGSKKAIGQPSMQSISTI